MVELTILRSLLLPVPDRHFKIEGEKPLTRPLKTLNNSY